MTPREPVSGVSLAKMRSAGGGVGGAPGGAEGAGRGVEVEATGWRRVAHGDDERLARVLLEVHYALVHLVARGDPSAGRVDLEHHAPHARSVRGAAREGGGARGR